MTAQSIEIHACSKNKTMKDLSPKQKKNVNEWSGVKPLSGMKLSVLEKWS